MFTSYYASPKIDPAIHAPIRISNGHPRWKRSYKDVGRILDLAPSWADVKASHAGTITPEEFTARYLAKLRRLNVSVVRAEIIRLAGGKTPVLLCFEKPGQPCHRHDFARWWREATGEAVSEL
jgi:hypothetical protein